MFTNVNFSWPDTLNDITSDSESALASSDSELDSAGDRLNAAPAITIENNPVSGSAAGSQVNYSALMNAMLTDVQMVCVHPWTQGIGQGETHYRYLSPANAVQAAAKKLIDAEDNNRITTSVDAVVIVVAAKDFDVFSKAIKQFSDVFPIADLQMCQRRSAQISTVEKDKIILPNPAINARWRWKGFGGIGHSSVAAATVGELTSHAVGYESGALSPDDEIQDLISKKKAALIDAQTAIDDIQSIFNDGVGRAAFFNSQSPAQIKNSLDSSGLSHDDPLACCVVFTSAPGKLTLIREMLGI